jgi:CBS-domain-containing membrane protein
MSQPVRSCSIADTADRAAQMMWDGDCGAVPVLDESGHLVGVITDRDICMAALFQGRPLTDIPIADVMSKIVYSCRPDDEVSEAEELMSVRQVRRLPVIGDDGTPVGMLSVSDVVQQVKPAPRFHKAASAPDECLRTLAAISEPRSKLQTTGSPRSN